MFVSVGKRPLPSTSAGGATAGAKRAAVGSDATPTTSDVLPAAADARSSTANVLDKTKLAGYKMALESYDEAVVNAYAGTKNLAELSTPSERLAETPSEYAKVLLEAFEWCTGQISDGKLEMGDRFAVVDVVKFMNLRPKHRELISDLQRQKQQNQVRESTQPSEAPKTSPALASVT